MVFKLYGTQTVSITTCYIVKTPYGQSKVALLDRKHNQHRAKCTEVALIYPRHTTAIMVRCE